MIWILFSILAGFFDSIHYSILKKLSNIDTYSKMVLLNLMALPFLLLGFIFFEIPRVPATFYLVTLGNILIFFLAQIMMIKSLKMSNLSISIPMLSFSPVFLLITSYLMLNEFPTIAGLFGVLLIVAGSYILNVTEIKKGYLEPIKSIFKNKGVFYMLIVALLFSISANLGKTGIQLSNPAFYMFMFYFIYSLLLLIIFFNRLKPNLTALRRNVGYFALSGFSTAASEILAGVALTSSIVPYIISLKRTSILFSVIIGISLFKEKNFKETIIGSAIMFFGVLLISTS